MATETTIVSTPEGEITRFAKGIDPFWKIGGAIIGLIVFFSGVYKTWSKIESNEQTLKELKEQVTRQYSTHKSEIDALRKDSDEELDVLEEELDKLHDEFQYHQAYEQALKDMKK